MSIEVQGGKMDPRDLVTEIETAEWRLNQSCIYWWLPRAERMVWENGDCLHCNSAFSVVYMPGRGLRCMQCGATTRKRGKFNGETRNLLKTWALMK
jgi:hypothetical protein